MIFTKPLYPVLLSENESSCDRRIWPRAKRTKQHNNTTQRERKRTELLRSHRQLWSLKDKELSHADYDVTNEELSTATSALEASSVRSLVLSLHGRNGKTSSQRKTTRILWRHTASHTKQFYVMWPLCQHLELSRISALPGQRLPPLTK
jgi:hypothetical protein